MSKRSSDVEHASLRPAGVLALEEGTAFARACVDAAGLHDRVEVTYDAKTDAIAISGPDHFGFLGTTAYVTLRIVLPASSYAIGIAAARHLLGEFYATDSEIAARAAELPLILAVALRPAAG